MPIYEYKCSECDTHFLIQDEMNGKIKADWDDKPEHSCDGERTGYIQRVFSFSRTHTEMVRVDGYNPTVGTYIRNDREFKNLLAKHNDTESERLGMEVKMAPVDLRDKAALGVKDEVLESALDNTNRIDYKTGKKTAKTYVDFT